MSLKAKIQLFTVLCFGLAAHALELEWLPNTNADGYVLYLQTAGSLFPNSWSVGNVTNYTLDNSSLTSGVNCFAVTAYAETDDGLMMSPFSNVQVVTNTPALSFAIFSTTNINSRWMPWSDHYVMPDCPQRFFKLGLVPTNIVTVATNT